jgi:hypothetical protein
VGRVGQCRNKTGERLAETGEKDRGRKSEWVRGYVLVLLCVLLKMYLPCSDPNACYTLGIAHIR